MTSQDEPQWVLASHNAGKVRELCELFSELPVALRSARDFELPEPAETGTTFEANAELKARAAADATGLPIFYAAIAAVLAGSVWGDHCSPISDTTIMSSMSSGCDHVAHVRTQMPYALLVGGVAVLFGTLPAGFGMPWWLGLLLGTAAMGFALRIFGRES